MVRLEQHKFYSMSKEWRSESLVHKSSSQPSLGQGKSKEIESREGGLFMTYLSTRVWFGPEGQHSFLVLVWIVVMTIVSCHGTDEDAI